MSLQRCVATLLFFLLLISSGAFAETAAEKLERINAQLVKEKQELQKTKQRQKESLTRLYQIRSTLDRTRAQLQTAHSKIGENESKISDLTSEIKDTNLELLYKGTKLKKRINEIYKNSSVNYLDMLLSAKSMSDFINRSYYFSKVLDQDVKLINELLDVYSRRQEKKDVLEKTTQEIKSLASQIAQKKEEITERAQEEKKVLNDLKKRREEYERRIAELERSSEELEALIQKTVADATKSGTDGKGSGSLAWPLRGRITSNFGYRRHPVWGGKNFHTGLDIAAAYGTPIRAADSGTVIMSGWWNGYGKAVVINHGNNTTTVYGHMSRIYANKGKVIEKGQIIGLVGSTGYSTGPHLHFEVRKSGKPKNPISFLP